MNGYLFIGGPVDGEWRVVEHDAPIWHIAEIPTVQLAEYKPVDEAQLITAKAHLYFRRLWRDKDAHTLHTFYVHQGLDVKDVFTLLVRGYRRPHVPKVTA